MKRIKFYQCPDCGNLLTATGRPAITCCGRQLMPMAIQPADEAHRLTITDLEDEKLLQWTHPMEKDHHLTFLAEVGPDSVHIVRLYPEGAQKHRLPRIPWGSSIAAARNGPGSCSPQTCRKKQSCKFLWARFPFAGAASFFVETIRKRRYPS